MAPCDEFAELLAEVAGTQVAGRGKASLKAEPAAGVSMRQGRADQKGAPLARRPPSSKIRAALPDGEISSSARTSNRSASAILRGCARGCWRRTRRDRKSVV